MRESFQVELDRLADDLARMARLASEMMSHASEAIQQADLALAELVISKDDEMDALHDDVEQRCVNLLALQAPVAADLRTVVSAMHAVADLNRMGDLAQHIAKIARLKHPTVTVPGPVRPVFARMGLLAAELAASAAEAIDKRDPLGGERLDAADDEVDALRRQLFQILFDEDWAHGVEPAVDAALIGRYYERFADHAVAIARLVGYRVTGQLPAEHHA
ncbi:MAG: phosphate signaling complex protein PhoU [Pseudonocardiaceae bacterium]|nr:phosphate signaling complex protein PhoU [Pseudonocardiaceae bacterium]